jgi:ABC-type branched-subunit amino acid transport system substrate-binding protein
MTVQDPEQFPLDQHDRPHYPISPIVRRFILLALVLSVPSWFLSVLFNANTLVTFFTIFFTVLSAATGLFQLFPAHKGKTNSPTFSQQFSRAVRQTAQKLTPPTRHLIYHARWGSFGLGLAGILTFGIWNIVTALYYQLDIGIMLLSALLLLLGIVSTLYFLPPIQKWLLMTLPSKISLIRMGRWPLALLLLMLALSGFWNIGLYRIADTCNGAQTVDPPTGIGVVIRARECVGLSDGAAIFDTARPDGALKQEAANQLRHGESRAKVLSLFDDAIAADPTDAEAWIYRENLWVGSAPHITIVATVILSGLYISDGRDTLQGIYIAQKEYNNWCRQQGSNCPLLNILIANTGSGTTDESQYAHAIAVQIMQAAEKDSTIVGIMDGLPSQSTFDINEEVLVHPGHILPMVAAKATSDFLTRMPHFLRVAPPNTLQAQMGARYAKMRLKASRVAVFYREENTYSGNLKDDFISEFQDAAHQIIAVEAYPERDPGVLRDKLTEVLNLKPDLIYCACYSNEVSIILEHLPSSGPFANLLVLGGDAFFELGDFAPGAQPHLSRLRFTALAYPDIWHELPAPGISFFTDYGKLFEPSNPHAVEAYGFTHLTPGIMVAYDAMQALTTTATRAFVTDKQPITPQNLENTLFQMKGKQAIQGITGQISFGGNGDPINKAIVVLSVDTHNTFHCVWLYGQFFANKPAPANQLEEGQSCATAADS